MALTISYGPRRVRRQTTRPANPLRFEGLPSIGPGVREIRIHTELEHRVFYVAAFAEAVYVLHAFDKRTRKTAPRDAQFARDRFRALVIRRRTDASEK